MAHNVFLSYSRENSALCVQVYQCIERIGYRPYRDVDDLSAGEPWRDQLEEALSRSDLKPYVVVLCTRAAVERSEGVLAEIRLAREKGLTLIPIEFDSGAMKSLFREAGFESPGQIQYIDAVDPSGHYTVGDRLEDDLRRSLLHSTRRWLDKARVLAKEWADRLTPKISFWETSWRDYFPAGPREWPGSVALTARGGSGKSFLIARCVSELLEDPEVYPVLIDESMLRDTGKLSRDLGARSTGELQRQIEALGGRERHGWKPMRLIFVVDGLDQMIVPGDVQQTELVRGLNLLVNSATVLIGCREEVWNAWYSGRVSVRESLVEELDEQQVRHLLSSTPLAGQFNPLLQVPFFLDIILQRASVWRSLPETETEFLRQLWSEAVTEKQSGRDTGRAWIVENLAACQLDQLTYEVPIDVLLDRPGYLPEYAKGRRDLRTDGLLVEQPRGGTTIIRMRHDLLDNYSMVRRILDRNKLEQARELCRRCDKDCGWSVLATLVQALHDQGDALKKNLFSEFLFLLDHKKFGDGPMARAWAVTHVLQTCFDPLFDLIREALDGEPAVSLDKENPDHFELRPSSLERSEITQEAASTLASAFMALQTGTVEDAAKAVPVLARGLQRWPLKARFVDALAKYRTDEALDAIASYARQQLRERSDLDSLRYVARNLKYFPQPQAAVLLREIVADTNLTRMVRRLAAESLNHLRPGEVEVPLRVEDEIVEGLRVLDGKRYSDWHVVQDYAADVRRRRAHGETFGPRVLDALIQALRHDQTFVRCSVAMALELFEEPAARDALLNELLEPDLPADVRSACLDALKEQLRRLADPRARQAFRYVLLRAAGAAHHAGAEVTERCLIDLAMDPALRRADDWPLTEQALEVLPSANAPWAVRCSLPETEVDPAILRDLVAVAPEDVGPNQEPKYRLVGLDAVDGGLDIELAPTTWQLGKSFHNAVRNHPDRFLRDGQRWLEPVPLGDARLPGLAVVHVIVLTADDFVLAAQRAKKLSYAPEHWSISFEEQVTELDFRERDRAFHNAAHRGMLEEFGVDVEPSRIHLISALLEMSNLNLAAVILINASQTLDEIRRSWATEPRPTHAWEADAVDGIEADPAVLDKVTGEEGNRLVPLHPTSRLRCAILARWLRSSSATSGASIGRS
jgi:TIR domain